MRRPGKMIKEVLGAIFKKPATTGYPYTKTAPIDNLRGMLKFHSERCIGCKLCMKDCPSGAITIKKVGDKQFEAEVDLSKCIFCGQCVDSCMKKALETTSEFELAVLDKAKLKVTFHAGPKGGTEGTV